MATIAFIILCHKDPEGIASQVARLTTAGDVVAVHLDARAGRKAYAQLRRAVAGNPSVVLVKRRVRCGWGEWSLVQATLNAVDAALDAFPKATHLQLLSGDCMPIKSASQAHAVLDAHDVDRIESLDFFKTDWIKAGIREERLVYRHMFNERRHKRLFYASIAVQRRLGLTRAIPADLQIRIGSQWWCLRRRTAEAIRAFVLSRPDVMAFFRRTWIPDETFFQTLVRHLVPETEIDGHAPTFLMFSDYGIPVTFHGDHYDLLRGQPQLFARKISADAMELKTRLGQLYAEDAPAVPVADEGQRLHAFMTGRGRIGRRFAPRIWETGSTLGRDRTLLVVVCKKWHVAKRLVERIGHETGVPSVQYLFDEAGTPLPDLGGIENALDKRGRHPAALLRLLFEHWRTERLAICVDPGRLALMLGLLADRASMRLLEVDCGLDDGYLAGHARRVGLATARTAPDLMARLLPVVRQDLEHERERLRDAGFPQLYRLREAGSVGENGLSLAGFLDIPVEAATRIAATDHLFMD